MTPYYEHGGVTIYHGDCLSVMADMDAGSVDLFLTDPPYGTRTTNRDGWMVGERANVMPIVLPELHRLGVRDAALYLFTSWKNLADWVFRCSPYFPMYGVLVFDKGRHSGCWGKFSWQFHWEGIYYGLKGPRPIRRYSPDVLRTTERPAESMQKPVDVLRLLVEASTDPGQTVLDPFLGTGGALIAASQLGRRAIGIEIEERYCEIAAKRLSQEILPLEANA